MWDGVDRRTFVRAEYPCLIKVSTNIPAGESILTHTENISVGGVRVIIRKKIEVMSEVGVELDLMDTLSTVHTIGRVRWVRTVPSSRQDASVRFDTGIQFTSLKENDRRRITNIVEHIKSKS